MQYEKIVLVAILWLLSLPTFAQAPLKLADCRFHLHGIVEDQRKNPVFGATVYIKELAKGDVTDEAGDYMIENMCAGEYTLICSYVGYEPDTATIRVSAGQIVIEHNFRLAENNVQLKTITITGGKLPLPPVQPESSLQGLELDRTRGLSLGESLKNIVGVNSIQTGPSISKPVIHGLHSNRVLIMNNGIRQEGQQWGSEHAPEIDPFIAKRITVIKGAASVRYGSDAIGGVVLVEPDPLPYSGRLSGEVNSVFSTNNRQGVISGILQGGLPKQEAFSWRIQGTAKRAGNSSTPDYYLMNTGVSEYNFSSTIGYRKAKFGTELFYSQFNTKIGIFAGSHIGNKTDFETALGSNRPLPEYQSGFSYRIGRPFQDINHYLLKAQSYLISDKLGKFSLALGHQFNYRGEYDSHRSLGSDYDGPQLRFLMNTFTTDFTWEHKPIARILTGVIGLSGIYQENDVKGRFLIPDFKSRGAGIFAVERFVKNQWEVEGGIRYDIRQVDIDMSRVREKSDPNLDFNKLTGTIGTTYKISPSLAAKINVGMGWRPPSINELFSDGIHHGEASYIKGQDSLMDETAYNFTAGLSYKTVKFQAELDAYHYLYNNYIYQKPEFPGVLTVRGYFPLFVYTQTDALISGLDVTGNYQFSHHFSWRTKYSMVRARNQSTHEFLPFFPADRLENTLRYHAHHALGVDNVYISFSPLFVAKQWRVLTDSDYAPPPDNYLLFNAEFGFSVPAVKGMDVGITIHNLLNTRYRDYLNRFRYYTDETGRNIHLRIKYVF